MYIANTPSGNFVQGNYIGTTADGRTALGNGDSGVRIADSAGNLIGGSQAGVRNVISGNLNGVFIIGKQSTKNQIAGNYIGLGSDGDTDVGNFAGIVILGDFGADFGAAGNLIGGLSEPERNVISGNDRFGVFIARTLGNTVAGNYIGTDWTGTQAVRNLIGVFLLNDRNSLIGGHDAGAGNVISGNDTGIAMLGGLNQGTRVEGNFIGTTADGQNVLKNVNHGLQIDSVRDATIGGTHAGAGNLISGNGLAGIHAVGANLANLRIQGNWIGTDVDGDSALANRTSVFIEDGAGDVMIGGTTESARNIISGNTGDGVNITGGSGNTVQGNYIGTTADGMTALGNGNGINIVNSSNNVLGGPTADARNIVSASTGGHGIIIQGRAATGNLVEGNYVGLGADGMTALGNFFSGIAIADSSGHTIRGNVSSANGDSGVYLVGVTTSNNIIEGNKLGTDATGMLDRGNARMGVFMLRATATTVRDNLISGNNQVGIAIDSVSPDNLIENNRIGTDETGNSPLGNDFGMLVEGSNNRIRDNVISGNMRDGVILDGAFVLDGRGSHNVLHRNLIGVGRDEVTAVGNGRDRPTAD